VFTQFLGGEQNISALFAKLGYQLKRRMTMINESNIFNKGMLISLRTGAYAGRKKLSADQLKDLPKEIVRGVHDLFEHVFKEKLEGIMNFDGHTRSTVKAMSVPFPIDGVYFLSFNKIEGVIEYLDARKEQRKELVEEVLDKYNDAIASFAEKYPDYYRRAKDKYPTKATLATRFYSDYQFIKISAPDKNPMISPEQYKREMQKFSETVAEMKKEVVGTIYQTMTELTERLKRQSKDGKMNQRTFNNLGKFLEQINDVYSEFVDRGDLKAVLDKIKAETIGVTADSLRDNDSQRKKFHKAISALTEEIKALPDVDMKRAIDF
jgi:hypothetical protein